MRNRVRAQPEFEWGDSAVAPLNNLTTEYKTPPVGNNRLGGVFSWLFFFKLGREQVLIDMYD